MKVTTWKQFAQTSYGAQVRRFFYKLNAEAAGRFEGSGGKEAGFSGRKGILLLNTKKGYWMYKVFEREERDVLAVEVISDRYVKKLVNFSFFQDKIVYLVDDTLTNGFSLFETYELLAGFMDEKYILPIVFALNESVDLDSLVRTSEGVRARFWEKLRYSVRMTAEDMGFFCVEETKLLHNENIPYVIDLPYLKAQGDSDAKMKYEVILTKEEFQALKSGSELWEFHSNRCRTHGDWGETILQGFIIQLKDEGLLRATGRYISDYMVMGTYQTDDEGKIHAVFIPFAISKSFAVAELESLWKALTDSEPDRQSGSAFLYNMQVKQYRECTYILSMTAGELFRKHLKELTGIALCYDYHVLEEHFQPEFIARAREIEEKGLAWPEVVCRKLAEPYHKTIPDQRTDNGADETEEEEKETYSEDSAYSLVAEKVVEKRICYLTGVSGNIGGRDKREAVLETGEMAEMLERKFRFSGKTEKRYAHSRITATLIQNSIGGTQILISRDGKQAEKVIRYGENSDLLLPFFDLNFYWAVILIVESLGKEKALRQYETFVGDLGRRFKEWGLYEKKERKMTAAKFNRNKEYYKRILENEFQLYNKYFFLYPYFRGELDEDETLCLKKVEDFVTNINY